MSTGSPLFKFRHITIVSLVGLCLTGCSSDSRNPAPISTAGGSHYPAGNGGLIRQPPVVTYPKTSGTSSTHHAPAPAVTVQEGKIVYQRSYKNIPKGSYSGGTYTVNRGDTLFYIAWITGNDFRDLAQRNGISAPYSLNVGQRLQISNGAGGPITGGNAVTAADARESGSSAVSVPTKIKTTTVAQQPIITYSDDSGKPNEGKMLPSSGTTVAKTTAPVIAPPTVSSTTNSTTTVGSWRWPTDGKIIDNFSAAEGGNKGIDIAGARGQSVTSTASGRVVYAGNALRGYGNLIIIKHNDDYLSAYAHNETMLVREQQEVKAGQKIATMGSTGTSSVRLHFEIRYKGKSVNPLRYLPQR